MSAREDSNALFQAWFAIADSDGKANVTWMWDPGYPFLVAELEREKAIIANDCSGCKAGEVGLRELEAAANPVRSGCSSLARACFRATRLPTTC